MCNETVEVEAGEAVTLNCIIKFNVKNDCAGVSYLWRNTTSNISCKSGLTEYICEWNKLTYVSLKISNVMEQDNYTVSIQTDCGMDRASISVKVKHSNHTQNGEFSVSFSRCV